MSTWNAYATLAHSGGMTSPNDLPLWRYMRALKKRSGLSLEKIADAASYEGGRSSVQRFFMENNKEVLSREIASRFAKALIGKGSPPIQIDDLARLIGATSEGEGALSTQALAKMLNLSVADEINNLSYVVEVQPEGIPVMGSAHASFWMPSAPSLDAPQEWLHVDFAMPHPGPDRYALRIIGPSVNREAADGHFAICARFGGSVHEAPENKFVHVERQRDGETEWTIKRVKWGPKGVLLCPHSDHKDHQKPIEIGKNGDHVEIRGIVTGWFKPA